MKKKRKIIFVTATNTDVGKSHSCEILLNSYAKKGYKVGYFKPIETGVKSLALDGHRLLNVAKKLNSNFAHIKLNDVVPYQFLLPASPFVAKQNSKISIKAIKKKMNYLLNFCDILVVEGAGGLLVPIKRNYFIIDLIKELNVTKTVLISPSNLGSINDTLLSQNALKSKGIKFKWYINLFKDKDSFAQTTLPFYKSYFKKIRYIV